ncbi:MAG: hypothetical protein PVH65_01820 [Chloroflexota bacterium]
MLSISGCSASLSADSSPYATRAPAVQIPTTAQSYVEMSKSALAQRLQIDLDQIKLSNVTEPATADGVTVVNLAADGHTYEYHGRGHDVMLVSETPPVAAIPVSGPDRPQVTLALNDAVAAAMTSHVVPAVEQTDQTPYWAVLPERVEVVFDNYAQPDSIQRPILTVYPVDKLEERNQLAADQVSALRELLIKKPDLESINPLPFLPLFNAQAMLLAQGQYLNFANGSGIRYLTQFGQAAGPVTNNELVYTFQGLTDDGLYYVAAVFPIAQNDLPADMASADTSFPDGFEAYIQSVKDLLTMAKPDSFTPDLHTLDGMVSTIAIQ